MGVFFIPYQRAYFSSGDYREVKQFNASQEINRFEIVEYCIAQSGAGADC